MKNSERILRKFPNPSGFSNWKFIRIPKVFLSHLVAPVESFQLRIGILDRVVGFGYFVREENNGRQSCLFNA